MLQGTIIRDFVSGEKNYKLSIKKVLQYIFLELLSQIK